MIELNLPCVGEMCWFWMQRRRVQLCTDNTRARARAPETEQPDLGTTMQNDGIRITDVVLKMTSLDSAFSNSEQKPLVVVEHPVTFFSYYDAAGRYE